jgi:hypothetical protein
MYVQQGRHLLSGRPIAGRPIAGRPIAGRPIAGRPIAGRPIAGRPIVGRPIAGRPTPSCSAHSVCFQSDGRGNHAGIQLGLGIPLPRRC